MRSKRTAQFRKMFDKLPEAAQRLAHGAYGLLRDNPNHPMLESHELHDDGRGRHRKASRAVSVSYRYRAIYVLDTDPDGERVAVWYWIGTHEEYNNFVGK